MSYKLQDKQIFRATVNGNAYTFSCFFQYTQHGFRHLCFRGDVNPTGDQAGQAYAKQGWANRTWENFTYETVLNRAIERCDESDREGLKDILIKGVAQSEHDKAEAFLKAFEETYTGLSDRAKGVIQRSTDHLTSMEQAQSTLAVMKCMKVLEDEIAN